MRMIVIATVYKDKQFSDDNITGLVIGDADKVRGNSGGLLPNAVYMANLFIDSTCPGFVAIGNVTE